MVLLNYEQFIKEKIHSHSEDIDHHQVRKNVKSKEFLELCVRLYEYCEEINIIEHRMKILAQQTQKMKGIKPKLLQSQIIKVNQKTKEISVIYSLFLLKQKKCKVLSIERAYFQYILQFIIEILSKCFCKADFVYLKKQINRLLKTNTFNNDLCWKEYTIELQNSQELSKKKKQTLAYDFHGYRRKILSEKSQIRPYVNNKSCFRSKMSRSPIVTLLYPTNEYLSFDLNHKTKRRKLFM